MPMDGLRAAAQALRYWEVRQQVVSHNLANVDTKAFKAERVFARLLDENLVTAESATNFAPGTLTRTGNALDVALEGPGFFVVDTPAGERLTRGGAFRLDERGMLVDAGGRPVLGENGPMVLPPGQIEIDARGTVRVEGVEIGRLRLEAMPAGAPLVREGDGLFVPADERIALDPETRPVRQGFLEESNVSAIESLVEMITVQRNFAAVQNGMRVLDGVMNTIANEIGRIG